MLIIKNLTQYLSNSQQNFYSEFTLKLKQFEIQNCFNSTIVFEGLIYVLPVV
jgi:hypothetical protein